jgi:ketosteroid isomerase-like protein
MTQEDIARAFSGHRFDDAVGYLGDEVRWIIVGQHILQGAESVIEACRSTATHLAETTTTWLRFVCVPGNGVVAVDAFGRYENTDGVSAVSSCDIYEFTDDKITTITTYLVEVHPDNVGAPPLGSET